MSVVVSSTFLLAIAARAAAMGKVVRIDRGEGMRLSGVARIRDGKGGPSGTGLLLRHAQPQWIEQSERVAK